MKKAFSIVAVALTLAAPAAWAIGPHARDQYHSVDGFKPKAGTNQAYCNKHYDPQGELFGRCIEKQNAGQAYMYLYLKKHGMLGEGSHGIGVRYANGDRSVQVAVNCMRKYKKISKKPRICT